MHEDAFDTMWYGAFQKILGKAASLS